MATYKVLLTVDPSAAVAGTQRVRGEMASLEAQANKTRTAVANVEKGWADVAIAKVGSFSGFIGEAEEAAMSWKGWQGAAKTATKEAEQGLSGVASSIGLTKQAAIEFAAITATAFAGQEIFELSDEYGNMENKLRQVTRGSADLEATTKKLFESANNNRVAVENEVTLYQRAERTMDKMGYTARQAMQFTDALTKTIATSGATSIEAAQGMIQLSQGLARGKLQGQDLKAVIEDIPAVAQVIASAMGVSVDRLQELGAKGKITGGLIVNTFLKSGQAINDNFAKTVPTAGQALQVFKNEMLELVGAASQNLGPALLEIANNLSDLLKMLGEIISSVTDLAKVFLDFSADDFVNGIKGALTLVKDFVGALDGLKTAIEHLPGADSGQNKPSDLFSGLKNAWGYINPLTAGGKMVGKVGEGISALDEMSRSQFSLVDAAKFAKSTAEYNQWVEGTLEQFRNLDQGFQQLDDDFGKQLDKKIEKADKAYQSAGYRLAKEAKDKAAEEWKKYMAELERVLEALDPVAKAQADVANTIYVLDVALKKHLITRQQYDRLIEREFDKERAALDPYNDELTKITELIDLYKLSNKEREKEIFLLEERKKLEKAGVEPTGQQMNDLYDAHKQLEDLKDLATRRDNFYKALQAPQQEAEKNLRALNDLWKEGPVDMKAYNDEVVKQKAAALGLSDALDRVKTVLEDLRLPGDKFKEDLAALNILYPEGTRNTLKYQLAVKALEMEYGRVHPPTQAINTFQEALKEALKSFTDLGTATFNFFQQLGKTLEDSIINALMHVKQNFEDVILGIMRQLAQLIIQILLTKALMAAFGGPANFYSFMGIAQGVQNGGSHATGGSYTVGGSGGADSQVVMARATPGERIIFQTPEQREKTEGGTVNLAPHIVNVINPRDILDIVETPAGQRVILNVIRLNKSVIKGM